MEHDQTAKGFTCEALETQQSQAPKLPELQAQVLSHHCGASKLADGLSVSSLGGVVP